MEDFEWRDPLLITADVTSLKQQHPTQICSGSDCKSNEQRDLPILSSMGNPDESTPTKIDGRSDFGFSFASPDLVCLGSPDVSSQMYEESPQFSNGVRIDVSLENGIEGSNIQDSFKASVEKMEDLSTAASFELLASTSAERSTESSTSVIGINVGSTKSVEFEGGIKFTEDCNFTGGDTLNTDDPVTGDGDSLRLYQSARFGDFTYNFENLESGSYTIDLHFAEIVFTSGPSGMRVFDLFLQEQKVVSCLDIYARVGANMPLVISDLKTCVSCEKGLSIRCEGVIGKPILNGIFIRKDSSETSSEINLTEEVGFGYMPQSKELNDSGNCDDELLKKELADTKRALEELKKENELKNRECQETWKSLKELQNELMRKSMHVGSLAFAIEGQVKEKSRWFSSLRDLTRKLKILRMDHINLSEDASLFKQYAAEMEDIKSIIQTTMNQHAKLHEDIKIKFLQEAKEKKELYNKVLELKGNIRVFCRCRPMNTQEIEEGVLVAVDFEGAKDGEITVKSNGISKKNFKFDAVFTPEANQVDVFEETSPLVTSVLDGYNVCIFAYGQTGTGKTFTMEGTRDARGVNYRTLERLFDVIEERRKTFRYEVSVSVLEVYNEQIRDLLVSESLPSTKRLEIKQVGEGGHHVPGLVDARVNNVSEVWDVLRTGSNGRAVGSTNANEHSSRSHCMHCVMVKGENLLNGECTRSKLWLVDLAGSERVAKTEVQGDRLKETQNINRSLSALGDVISALATKSPHIPFRNSKLTHLLQDSLGGDSKALMFVQISPNENDLTETLCSLNFASRVRGIELGPAKKQMDRTECFKYKQMADKLKQDLKSKELQVKKLEDMNYSFEVKIKERDVRNRNLQEKIKELEAQLLVERRLARQHVDTKIAEQHRHEEHNREPVRAPFAPKVQKSEIGRSSAASLSTGSGEFSFQRPPSLDGYAKGDDLIMDKENNPEIAEQQQQLPKPTGRVSLCPMIHQTSAPRRNSLIPRPSLPGNSTTAKLLPPATTTTNIVLPLTPIQSDTAMELPPCLPEQKPCDSPKDQTIRSKKLSSALRRSLQRKMNTKTPLQAPIRRVGVNVGMEKLRISIGSRGKTGQRMFLSNARRAVAQQKQQNHREKERGWNIGTATRTLV